jgi:ATP-dependent DNA helicase RecQ
LPQRVEWQRFSFWHPGPTCQEDSFFVEKFPLHAVYIRMDPREALRKYFGFDEFRPGQEEIVNTIVSGKSALVVMPTGGGKSLCYQLPALMLSGPTLVVSPLIALMKDQVDALRAKGIEAETINSTLSQSEQDERISALAQGRIRILYVAPERFGQRRFVEALRQANVSLVAVDEAHCVSQWGHDFRPDYLKIGRAVNQIGHPTIAAFTATATPDVRVDIIKHLALEDPKIFVTGFARPNLSFSVVKVSRKLEKFAHLRALVQKEKTGIIYCATRKRVEEVFEEVQAWGTRVVAYHGGMNDEGRSAAQERFISRRADVAVATNAFGMGIDRADIRFVAHYEMPGSVEAYYQEAGRAGRDGSQARCDFLYSFADKRVQEFFIEGSNPDVSTIRLLWNYLKSVADAKGDVRMSLGSIAEAIGIKNDMTIGSALAVLLRARYVDRFDIQGQRMRGTRVLRADLAGGDLQIDETALAEKSRRDNARLQSVIDYATSGGCRQEWILRYFGDSSAHSCGMCDWCLRARREGLARIDDEKVMILRKALSGVARMSRRVGQDEWEGMFGLGKICDMLCGREKGPMRQHGLDKLSTFGLLADQGVDFTKALVEECIFMGLLKRSNDDYLTVTLTKAGTDAMRGSLIPEMLWPDKDGRVLQKGVKAIRGEAVDSDDFTSAARTSIDDEEFVSSPVTGSGSKKEKTSAAKKKRGKSSLFDDDESAPAGFDELFDELKKKRLEMARIRGVRAFQIFPDRTLEAMALARPVTRDEALGVPGIGPHKADHEFPEFVPIIERYL